MATTWTDDELDRVGASEELKIASLRRDGELSKQRTIWVVRVGDGIYVRSVYGTGSDWYRSTRAHKKGHIRAGGVAKDVAFVDVDEGDVIDRVDAAYRSKYHHYAAEIIKAITGPEASSTTMRVDPR
ncbi:DUF2255 family protein [Streptomyces phaeoluteigriseus]